VQLEITIEKVLPDKKLKNKIAKSWCFKEFD